MNYTYPTWLTGILVTIALIFQTLSGSAQYERTTVDGSIIGSTPSKTIFTSDGATLELSKHENGFELRKYAEDGTMLWGKSLPLTAIGNYFELAPDQQGGAAIGLYVGRTPLVAQPDSVLHYFKFLTVNAVGDIILAKKIKRDIFVDSPAGKEFIHFQGFSFQSLNPAGFLVTCNYTTGAYSTVDLFRLTENLEFEWAKSVGELISSGVPATPTLIFSYAGIITKPFGNGNVLFIKNASLLPEAILCTELDQNGEVVWTKQLEYTNSGSPLYNISATIDNSGKIQIAGDIILATSIFVFMPILSGTGELLTASLYRVNYLSNSTKLELDGAGNRILMRTNDLLIADTFGSDARFFKTTAGTIGNNNVTLSYNNIPDYLDGTLIRDMTMKHQDQITAFSVYRQAQLRLPYDQLPSCYFVEDTAAYYPVPLSILNNTDTTDIISLDISPYFTISDTIITTQTLQDQDWGPLCSLTVAIDENPTSIEQQFLYPTLLFAGQPLTLTNSAIQRIEVWNASGQLIQQQTVSSDRTIPTSSLTPGLYAVKAYGSQDMNLGTTRMVVE